MKVAGFQKLTLLDYPEEVACIVFTKGCNFACPFCHNSSLIDIEGSEELISENEIFSYLEKRKNILSGVVITGGEPTIQKDLKEFIIKIKKLGYKVKLDTNGYNPFVLKDLIDNDLLDYVAMDVKNSLDKYAKTSGFKNINLANIIESINILKASSVQYEFRTTIMKEHHNESDISKIIDLIGTDSYYYLQNFKDRDTVLDRTLHEFSENELNSLEELLKKKDRNIKIR